MNLVKSLVVSLYYLIYLTLDYWMNVYFCVSLMFAVIIAFQYAKQKKVLGKYPWVMLAANGGILYIAILMVVLQTGGLVPKIERGIFQWIYYILTFIFVLQISNRLWGSLLETGVETRQENTVFFKRIKNTIYAIGMVSMIPVIMISPYVFARADDYSFGYHCRAAWEDTGSLWEVIKGAFAMIEEAFVGWQGTYSSIFMMAIQPAVFDERLYAVVPMFFVLIITASSCFFLKTILIDWLNADRTISKICIGAYLLLGIQCIPVIQSAFFWYNGAVHYITSHCMQLCMMAFLIRLYIGKRRWTDYLGCIVSSIYVGGGNLMTLVGTLFLTLTIMLVIFVTKSWRKKKNIAVMCVVYWGAMAVNLIAPGNYSRLEKADGMGLIESFFQAFIGSAKFLFGEWMHWSVVLVLLFLIPFLWKIVRSIKISFSYPLMVIGYSWCYLASLFFPMMYGAGGNRAGRYENIMFLQGILLLFFNIAYVLGWIQRKYDLMDKECIVRNERVYLNTIAACIGIGLMLGYFAEPTRYLTLGCIDTLGNREALQEYSQDYWENVAMFTSGEDNITANNLYNIPEFLEARESEAWHAGVRPFYRFQGLEFK